MELTMTWWQILVAVVGAFGGLEAVKWVFNHGREARTDEFKILRETNLFLQQQLKEKEERFNDQTQLVRRLNNEVLHLTRTIAEREIELTMKRCDNDECPFRQPPNAKTPPKPGTTLEQYHAQRQ